MINTARLILTAMAVMAVPAMAKEPFHAGKVMPLLGQIANVDADLVIPADTVLKVDFDDSTPAEAGKVNRTLETAARFINMHAEAGVPVANIHVAVVLHGQAIFDISRADAYARKYPGKINTTEAAVADLIAHGVRVIACGQSAAALGVEKKELLPGVELALSAMTAHALLLQNGYTLNPF